MPSLPQSMAPVGKSGPGMRSSRSSTVQSGFRATCTMAAVSSRRLWGGMFVAIPTAMPDEPLASRLGKRVGSTTGSCICPSKLGANSTVSRSMSCSISSASGCRRASV